MIDTNFTITEITNSWAATVTELGQYQYKLKGTYTSTIDANSSVTLGFIGTKIGNPEISNHSLTEVKVDSSKMTKPSTGSDETIKLSASTKELLTTEDNQVFFYAKPNYKNVTSIELIDSETNTVFATMYDDGDFGNHGDDLENDGTFSCMIDVDNSVETELIFLAKDESNLSNFLTISIYEDISDDSIAEMISVNTQLQNLVDSVTYQNLEIPDKIDVVNNFLCELADIGTLEYPYSLIDSSSIIFNMDSYMYTFTYRCGINGYFGIIATNDEYENEFEVGTASASDISFDEIDDLIAEQDEVKETNYYLGTARIIYDLNVYDTENHPFSYSRFESLSESWTEQGLYSTITNNHQDGSEVNTIDELKKLSVYDYVVIAAHGADNDGNPIIAVNDPGNAENYKKYKKDLQSGRIAPYGKTFIVSHKFFDSYYGENELNNTLFYYYSCQIFGVNDTVDYNMYDSLHSAGAETVVGYCNTLWSTYGNFMLASFSQNMINGYTAGESMAIAEEKYKNYNKGEIPVVAGNVNKSWANSNIKNGDFESHDSTPKYWSYSGDVRILCQLGNYIHNKNNFLFMSTGIGAQSEYECSQVNQVFQIPAGATTLTLSYNVISEEPMEWIGDEYDDEFTVNIYSGTNYTNVIRESTNQSTWYRTDITNFYGGDNTMYETQWKTVSIDVSQYAGTVIQLEFNMNNIGDNTYDSAVMIDNIKVV